MTPCDVIKSKLQTKLCSYYTKLLQHIHVKIMLVTHGSCRIKHWQWSR